MSLHSIRHTFWSPADDQRAADLELEFDAPVRFGAVSIGEHLPLGQRIDRFAVDVWEDATWREVGAGESIGARRLVPFEFIETQRVRVRILAARACPAITEIEVGG